MTKIFKIIEQKLKIMYGKKIIRDIKMKMNYGWNKEQQCFIANNMPMLKNVSKKLTD
jgi:hypothetical protein